MGPSNRPVAVVTGAGRAGGIGFACARQLAVSPAASYLTGQVIVVDGANSIAEERGSSATRPAVPAPRDR